MSKPLLRTAAAGALLGVSFYVGQDVVGEYTTYCILRDHALAIANKDEQLEAQIGKPYVDGPWYNASIGFTQTGHIAAVTFPLKGSSQITDVSVRAVRRPGVSSTALYNLTSGEWKVLDCSAMAPQAGGMVKPRSLMPVQAVPKVVDGKVIHGEECEECNRKAAAGSAAGAAATPSPAAAAPAEATGDVAAAPAPGAENGAQQKKRRRFFFF
ncbi:hypothetical protein Agub_g13790 [Astrephomene gubernaculifera]|uniref:Uncharacterized protein n=1 Tax=Astrephomene gubernaculifera TaxID=47775 RepID=A0AAD3HSV6_9CHLO|nr:hypothetical protein Agub_g13790 [Astrephomene gubernaculifera]